jgi:hypothetical protein
MMRAVRKPGGSVMGCMCKKILRILSGLALVFVSLRYLMYDPWLIVGLYLLLRGLLPMVCGCEGSCCAVEGKKKR